MADGDYGRRLPADRQHEVVPSPDGFFLRKSSFKLYRNFTEQTPLSAGGNIKIRECENKHVILRDHENEFESF